jgi:4-diphosphocytidyl-2-C-methyl-D-erythritol kinase
VPAPAPHPEPDPTATRIAVVRAPAKLTVSLRVVGRRPDGYHLLDAEMVSVDLVDELTFTDGDGLDIVDDTPGPARPGGRAAVAGGSEVVARLPRDDRNLVRKALRATGRTAHVRLVKRIPPGAGLGGGSSDAAAVLRWAGVDDVAMAASLGADVPFCLRGGRARVRGIGEQIEPQAHRPQTFTLLIPPFGCSTPAVYQAFDDLGARLADGPNDLEPAALAVQPDLARWRDQLAEATGAKPRLAGSGSTWFVEGAFPGDGRVVVRTLPPE